MPGEVYDKAGEKLVILDVRTDLLQPIVAPNWTDLRVGWFLSLTDETADDTITALGPETLTGATHPRDCFWIGLKSNNAVWPRAAEGSFIGFSNTLPVNGATQPPTDMLLLSSDGGIGVGTNFWRPTFDDGSVGGATASAVVFDESVKKAASVAGAEIHFPQNTAGAGGYAVLLGMRLQRDSQFQNAIRISLKSHPVNHSGDLLFTNTPTKELLITSLETWTASVQLLTPGPISVVPDVFFLYWPFRNSRLRIHAMGFVKLT